MPQRLVAPMHVTSSSGIRGRGLTLMMCVDAAPLTGMSHPSSIGIPGICARPILPWVPASDRRDSSLLPARPDMLDATSQMPARAIFSYEPRPMVRHWCPYRTMGARRRHRCNQGRRWQGRRASLRCNLRQVTASGNPLILSNEKRQQLVGTPCLVSACLLQRRVVEDDAWISTLG